MRVFEIVRRDLGDRRRIVVDAPAGEDLVAILRLADDVDRTTVSDDHSEVSGLLVLATDAVADEGRIARSLGRLVRGGDAVVLIGETPSALPVGRVVDAFVSSGVQVRGLSPLTPGRWSVAVFVTRTEQLLPMRSYLSGASVLEIGNRQLLCLVAKHALEGLALKGIPGWRRFHGGAGRRSDYATSTGFCPRARQAVFRPAASQVDLERSRTNERRLSQRVDHLERSVSLAIGGAVVSMRHNPFGGAREILRVVRQARSARTAVRHRTEVKHDHPRD